MLASQIPFHPTAEVIELIRKFLLCGCLRFVQPGSATQVVVGITFCVFYLSLIAFYTPYNDSMNNFFSTICQVIISVREM